MTKSLVDMVLDRIFDDEWKGRRGEKLTERELKLVKVLGRDGELLHNVYVPKPDGSTSEIDVLFITRKGIFVIESKNYSGWIFGNEADRYWTASLPNGQKNRFYNPISQNRGHLKWLSKYLRDTTPLFSLVVFSERCELKKVTVASDDVKVVKRDRLYAAVRDIWNSADDALEPDEVRSLHTKLEELTDVDKATKEAHIARIERECKAKPSVKPSRQQMPLDGTEPFGDAPVMGCVAGSGEKICPRCGGKLVLRTAKKGPNSGNQFLGCENFPKCRHTEAI